jgi:hypothetical protein
VLLGDESGVEVVVAAPVRPADVVEEEEWQVGTVGASGDRPQLLGDRVVVVVAVDDHGVRERDPRQRLQARLAHQLQVVALLRQPDEVLLGGGVDRADARP